MAWLFLFFVFAGCSSQPPRAPVGDHSARPVHNPGYHRVGQGDTLYSIAFEYGYSLQELAAWNGLRPPYTIYRGQKLRVKPPPPRAKKKTRPRVVASKPKTRSTVTASRPKTRGPVSASRPKTRGRTASATNRSKLATAPAASHRYSQRVIWSWPAKGRIIRKFNARSAGKKGIDIAGRTGDPVRAAAAGRVVYAGSGLSGYGRLIIVKHNKDFLSAYAHNRTLIASEGQWVKKGEVIARMGSSGTDRTQLHFEIRRRGRPVDPLRYLPKR